jgi:hypothetical protein
MTNRERFEAAIFNETGEPVDITRIEIEGLMPGMRWILWSGERRLYTCPISRQDLPAMLQATALLCQVMAHGNLA